MACLCGRSVGVPQRLTPVARRRLRVGDSRSAALSKEMGPSTRNRPEAAARGYVWAVWTCWRWEGRVTLGEFDCGGLPLTLLIPAGTVAMSETIPAGEEHPSPPPSASPSPGPPEMPAVAAGEGERASAFQEGRVRGKWVRPAETLKVVPVGTLASTIGSASSPGATMNPDATVALDEVNPNATFVKGRDEVASTPAAPASAQSSGADVETTPVNPQSAEGDTPSSATAVVSAGPRRKLPELTRTMTLPEMEEEISILEEEGPAVFDPRQLHPAYLGAVPRDETEGDHPSGEPTRLFTLPWRCTCAYRKRGNHLNLLTPATLARYEHRLGGLDVAQTTPVLFGHQLLPSAPSGKVEGSASPDENMDDEGGSADVGEWQHIPLSLSHTHTHTHKTSCDLQSPHPFL